MLDVLCLDKDDDKKKYRLALESLENTHPYYTIEFLEAFSSERGKLRAFLFRINNELSVAMPFYIRTINHDLGHDDIYFDVISPYGFSGPILRSNLSSETYKDFWQAIDKWYADNNVISEFIRFNLNENHMFYTGSLVNTLKIITGALTNYDSIWSNYESKVRKNVKKAQKHELTATIFSEEIPLEAIDAFYGIYITTMERKSASEAYFYTKDLLTDFINKSVNSCAIVLVYKDGVPISTELVLLSNTRVFSFLGGTLSEYFNLRANDFLKNEVIKWAQEHNFKYYVLGGGQKDDDGIFRYKKAFFKNDFSMFLTGRKIVNQHIYDKLSRKHMSLIGDDPIDFFPLYRLKK